MTSSTQSHSWLSRRTPEGALPVTSYSQSENLFTTRRCPAVPPPRTQTSAITGGRDRVNQEKTTVTTLQFRLNGIIIPFLKVRPVMRDGIVDHWELVACHNSLGEFAIDDNEALADPALTRFVLEARDATLPPIQRRFLPNKGWRQVTTRECISLLESTGVIDRP